LRAVLLESAPLRAVPLRAVPLRAVDLQASPLRAVPLRAVAAVDSLVDCTVVDCVDGSLGDAADLGAIRSTTTVGDLLAATDEDVWSGLTLGDLIEYGDTTIGDITDFGDATVGELIDGLPPVPEYTLGDLLKALLPADEYPWEELDFSETPDLRAAATTPGGGGEAGDLIEFTLDVDVVSAAPYPFEGRLDLQLPDTYGLIDDSARATGATAGLALGEPTRLVEFDDPSFPVVVRIPIADIAAVDEITFDVVPGVELGQGTTRATIDGITVPITGAATWNTSVAGGWEEPNDTPATATTAEPDTLYIAHIDTPTDLDLFEVTVGEGQRLSAILSNLPADFDLVLYAPTTAPIAGRPSERILVPVPDEPIGLSPGDTPAPAEAADDLDLASLRVAEVAQRRGVGDERIDTGRLRAGTYYLGITGYNRSTSTKPYALRVTLDDTTAPIPACSAWSYVGADAERGTLPPAAAYAGVDTIFVINRERLFGKYPADAADVIAGLDAFVTETNADPGLGVRALVVPIDGEPAVEAAYAQWESGSNRCDPLAARDVASAIASTLDTILAAHPGIEHVVIVGGDDIVPFGRVPDTTRLANERQFAQELTGNDELVASMRGGWLLTDDVYVDRSPVQVGNAELYVPNVALGRLVETPADIIAALGDFVANDGHLDARTALSVGYDFLTDGSTAVRDAFEARGFTTQANADALIGDDWDAEALRDALLGLDGFVVPDIASLNAHYDDHRALPANENANPLPTNLFDTDDIPTLRTLARSLLFSVGCHGGLNVTPGTQPGRPQDWAATYASQGAIWISNTGFGYGDTEIVAASEKLMALFAEGLDGRFSVGQTLLIAKQQYIGELGDVVTPYDVKVAQQMTFYGLPMYRLQAQVTPPAPLPEPAPVVIDPRTGLPVTLVDVASPVAVTPDTPGALVQTISDRGTYYTVDGDAMTVQNRPIQPRTTRDVTRLSPSGEPLGRASGGLVTALTSVDVQNVDPVVFRPIVNSVLENEPPTSESLFPASIVSIGENTRLIDVAGTTRAVPGQQLVVVPGQFRPYPEMSRVGTQRLFTLVRTVVHYAPVGDTDTTAPVITAVTTSRGETSASISVEVTDEGDGGGVRRVLVLAAPADGVGEIVWLSVDLVRTGASTWTGAIVGIGGGAFDFLVQAVDTSGNVGVSSNKGDLYDTNVNVVDDLGAPQIELSSAEPFNGTWYGGPVTVTATDPNGLAMSWSIDGSQPQPYVAPFVVDGGGQRDVVLRNTAGLRSSRFVLIDDQPPTVDCGAPPTGWSGSDVAIPCVAGDAVAGLAAAGDASFDLLTAVPDDVETSSGATGTRSVCDAAGRCTDVGPISGIRVDKRAPTATITSPTAGAVYDDGQVVLAAFACVDAGSGLASCAGAVANGAPIDTSSPGVKTFTVTTRDAVGNIGSRVVEYEVRDSRPPVIDCTAVPSTWQAANVTIECTASDSSGLANAADASFTLSTSIDPGVETANATTPSRTVCDRGGNCSVAGPFGGIKIDRRAPAITITAPVNGASVAPGSTVLAAYGCNEGGSGEVACVGTVAVGAPIDTAPGSKSFTVVASDAVGNTASQTVTYTVTATNAAPVVRADMGVSGLEEIGFRSGVVLLTGSVTDPDGSGPYTASVRWTATGPWTPLIITNGSAFAAAWLYATAGTRQVTVRVCDAAGACGTDTVTVRTGVTQRVTPTRCVVDRGASQSPRYEARFGYVNPAPFPIYVPFLPFVDNTFTSTPTFRGQPSVFLPGTRTDIVRVRFSSGSVSWRLDGATASASASSPRC
jgi:hypothetical protein